MGKNQSLSPYICHDTSPRRQHLYGWGRTRGCPGGSHLGKAAGHTRGPCTGVATDRPAPMWAVSGGLPRASSGHPNQSVSHIVI